MNIALATELIGPADEGMRVWLKHYRRALSAAGHRVVDVNLEGVPRWSVADPRNLVRLRAARPDVIQYVPYSGLTAASLLRLRVLGMAVPRARTSIAVLQSGRDGFAAPLGLAADVALFASRRLWRVTGRIARTSAVVYPVVDTSRFAPTDVDKRALRRELGIPGAKPLVLHVGHLQLSRNLGVLADLATRGDLTVVMVASTSTDAHAGVRAELETAGVRVIRRFVPDIERFYQAADVYVFPVHDLLGSIEVPLSVVEARATGLPTVATPFGALPELFAPSSGMVFSVPEGFADAVTALLAREHQCASAASELAPFSEARFVRTVEGAFADHVAPARTIVLSGVDGAGKSTQIKLLLDEMQNRGLEAKSLWCRWDPLLAKPAVRVLGIVAARKATIPSLQDSEAATSSVADTRRAIRARLLNLRVVALIWRALLVLDYGMRLAPAVRKARRTNDVLLLDRYWQDVMVDFSYGGDLADPPALLRRLLPDADGIVILDVPESLALKRKTDTPDLPYLSERRRLYSEVAKRYQAVVLDASSPADEVFALLSAEVERIIGPVHAESMRHRS